MLTSDWREEMRLLRLNNPAYKLLFVLLDIGKWCAYLAGLVLLVVFCWYFINYRVPASPSQSTSQSLTVPAVAALADSTLVNSGAGTGTSSVTSSGASSASHSGNSSDSVDQQNSDRQLARKSADETVEVELTAARIAHLRNFANRAKAGDVATQGDAVDQAVNEISELPLVADEDIATVHAVTPAKKLEARVIPASAKSDSVKPAPAKSVAENAGSGFIDQERMAGTKESGPEGKPPAITATTSVAVVANKPNVSGLEMPLPEVPVPAKKPAQKLAKPVEEVTQNAAQDADEEIVAAAVSPKADTAASSPVEGADENALKDAAATQSLADISGLQTIPRQALAAAQAVPDTSAKATRSGSTPGNAGKSYKSDQWVMAQPGNRYTVLVAATVNRPFLLSFIDDLPNDHPAALFKYRMNGVNRLEHVLSYGTFPSSSAASEALSQLSPSTRRYGAYIRSFKALQSDMDKLNLPTQALKNGTVGAVEENVDKEVVFKEEVAR